MQIVEIDLDPATRSCCECHKAMRHVGTANVTPKGFLRLMTFECACGTTMVEEATLH